MLRRASITASASTAPLPPRAAAAAVGFARIAASSAAAAAPPVAPPPPCPLPSPMRTNFINRKPTNMSICQSRTRGAFRNFLAKTDISSRELQFTFADIRPLRDTLLPSTTRLPSARKVDETANTTDAAKVTSPEAFSLDVGYGERLEDLTVYWRKKHFGNVTFGPRNYPYPISRWLGRRFQMKKHRILKRFRFRRYKLAAVANLPFAKMIRVGLLPEFKSSKSKKGDTVDAGLGAQLSSAAKASAKGKEAGKRSRPRSKYQI